MNVTEVPPSLDNCNDNSTLATEYDVWQQVLISVLAIGLSLATVIGNSMVMIAIRIDKQLQTISNNFLFSLAVADFAIGLISMPLFTVYTVFGYWPFGSIVCDTWLALDYLASNASVLNLLIISFDRFFSVTRPLTYRAKRTPKKAAIMIAGAWGISILLWPPWIYAWPYIEGKRTVPKDECYIQFIETNHYITFGTAIAAFYVPASVMMLLYWRIWRETEKRIKDLKELQEGKQDASKRSNSSDEALDMEVCRRGRSASSVGHDDVNSSNFASSYLERRYPDAKNRPMSWSSLKMWCIAWWHSGREDDDDEDDITATDVPSKTMYPGDETLTPVSAETPFNSTISRPSLTCIPSSESSQVRKNMSADPVYTIVIKLPPSSAPSITMYEDLISLHDHHRSLESQSVIENDDRRQPRRIDSVTAIHDVRLPLTIKSVPKSVTCTNVKPPPKKKKRTQDKKAAKILSAILAAFVLTWTPYNILVLLKPLTRACIIQIPPELWSFFYYLCYINSTINPLCYALCNANFRKTYWRILQCKWRRNASRAYCPP